MAAHPLPDHPLLNHAEIAARIPHADRMCLLGAVIFWDAHRIVCSASSHRALDHPLRAPDGSLGIAAGIEYAAQAMAVHGSLLAEQANKTVSGHSVKPSPGMLASVRAVEMHACRLDDIKADLQIEATQIAADAQALVYAFKLHAFESAGAADGSDDVDQAGAGAGGPPDRPGRSRHSLLMSGRASVMLLADGR